MSTSTTPYIDRDTVTRLDADSWAAEVVTGDGERWPWILTRAGLDGNAEHGCDCEECAPHEQGGHIRVGWLVERGLRTICTGHYKDGRPCAASTVHPSGRCGRHREAGNE